MMARIFTICFACAILLQSSSWAQRNTQSAEPMTWEKVVELALRNNTDFRQAQLQVEEVEGRIISDRAKYLTKVDANALTLPPTAVFSFTQPVFTTAMLYTGKTYASSRSGASINVQLRLIELVNQLRVAYAKALYTERVIAIRQKEVELLEDRSKRTQSLFDAGSATKDQITSLKVKMALAHNTLKQSRTDAELARVELAEIIGLGAGDPRIAGKLTGEFVNKLPSDLDVTKLQARAYVSRQDIKLLEELKIVANQTIHVTAAPSYPIVGVGGTLFASSKPSFLKPILDTLNPQSAQKDEDDDDIQNSRATLVESIRWRIYDGGATLGAVRSARADAVKQDVLLRQVREMIPVQVDTALKAVLSSYNLLQEQEKKSIANESLRLAQNAFEAGQVSQLEVIDAQQDYITYQLATLKLKYTLDIALAALDRVIGDKVVILDEMPAKRDSVARSTP